MKSLRKLSFETLLDQYESILTEDWFRLLRDYWMDTYSVGYISQIKDIFERHPVERLAMMGRIDLDGYANFPNAIQVFRGCYKNSRLGMSWTAQKRVALLYLLGRDFILTQPDEQPLLLEAIIPKSLCVYLYSTTEVVWAPHTGDFGETVLSAQYFLDNGIIVKGMEVK